MVSERERKWRLDVATDSTSKDSGRVPGRPTPRHPEVDYPRMYRNSYAKRLLDIADKDYIAARALFAMECMPQFLFLAQQSLEKYFKVALLYRAVRYKLPNPHDIVRLAEVFESNRIGALKARTTRFIERLCRYGPDPRYLSISISAEYADLRRLDSAAWDIRRYCQNDVGRVAGMVKARTRHLIYALRRRHQIIFDGWLEKTLHSKRRRDVLQQRFLRWNNTYFGTFRGLQSGLWMEVSPLFMRDEERNRETYLAIRDYIYLPRSVHRHFADMGRRA